MKEIIKTDSAPAAVGPYSQAIKVTSGEMIFCSGQIALDPKSGQLVGETSAAQTEQVLKNLQAVLRASGVELKDVVKTTIYLVDMNDFVPVNEVYGRFFSTEMPARAAVQVAALPKGARVMIEAIAVI